jgi:hypothetical protein
MKAIKSLLVAGLLAVSAGAFAAQDQHRQQGAQGAGGDERRQARSEHQEQRQERRQERRQEQRQENRQEHRQENRQERR